jgi:hypothetical protein
MEKHMQQLQHDKCFQEVHKRDDNELSSEYTLLQFSHKVFGAIPEVIS